MESDARLPTDDLDALARGALAARVAAAALRWLAACAVGFAGLLVLAVSLASFERGADGEPAGASAAAYLDLDLSVLRELAGRSLEGSKSDDAHRALLSAWTHRPDWQVPAIRERPVRLVALPDAWAATVADKSRFRTAARGATGALPFLLGGLALAFAAAAIAGVLAHLARAPPGPRWRDPGRVGFGVAIYVLVLHPLWQLLDPAVFYDRTRSLGSGLSATLFVAAFAGTLSGAAARALFAETRSGQHLAALGRHPPLLTAARIAALDAAEWLVPLVPALAAAALFVCAKADLDAGATGSASGLGALVRAAMREPSVAERVSSCALIGGALVLLCFVGHRFVIEARAALGVGRVEP